MAAVWWSPFTSPRQSCFFPELLFRPRWLRLAPVTAPGPASPSAWCVGPGLVDVTPRSGSPGERKGRREDPGGAALPGRLRRWLREWPPRVWLVEAGGLRNDLEREAEKTPRGSACTPRAFRRRLPPGRIPPDPPGRASRGASGSRVQRVRLRPDRSARLAAVLPLAAGPAAVRAELSCLACRPGAP